MNEEERARLIGQLPGDMTLWDDDEEADSHFGSRDLKRWKSDLIASQDPVK